MRWILKPAAEDDLAATVLWYEQQVPELGMQYIVRFEEKLHFIRQWPEATPVIFSGVRRVRRKQFPYGIFYTIEDDSLIVLRILHLHRDIQAGDLKPQG